MTTPATKVVDMPQQANIYVKLAAVQQGLKVPKTNYNDHGKFKYRSCTDILEMVKPLLDANGLTLVLNDEIITQGDRFYIKATATVIDLATSQTLQATAYAREGDKGRNGNTFAQETGSTSSYARKYALNGLLLIDDAKDPDADSGAENPVNVADIEEMYKVAEECGFKPTDVNAAVKKLGKNSVHELIKVEKLSIIRRMREASGGRNGK